MLPQPGPAVQRQVDQLVNQLRVAHAGAWTRPGGRPPVRLFSTVPLVSSGGGHCCLRHGPTMLTRCCPPLIHAASLPHPARLSVAGQDQVRRGPLLERERRRLSPHGMGPGVVPETDTTEIHPDSDR